MKEITFFARSQSTETFNDKPVHCAWPRYPSQNEEGPISWACNRNSVDDYLEATVDNMFEEVYIEEDYATRYGTGNKIPQALVYNAELDVYFKFDFRVDGLLETIAHCTIDKGKITDSLVILYVGSTYYIVPTFGKTYEEKVLKRNKSVLNAKYDIGALNQVYDQDYTMYLGKFKCLENMWSPNETSDMHVYIECNMDESGSLNFETRRWNYNPQNFPTSKYEIIISKSKRKLVMSGSSDERPIDTTFNVHNYIASNYQVYDRYLELDLVNKTFKIKF